MTKNADTAQIIEALITMGEALSRAVTVGNPAPVVKRMHDWMSAAPEPGDLVLETSTMHRGASPDRLGTFMRTERRAVCHHEREDVNLETCAECPANERMHERYVWIETLLPPCGNRERCADRTCPHRHRWHNASFIRLPATSSLLEAIERVPGASGGGIDRAGLVDHLSDKGFTLNLDRVDRLRRL